MNLANKIITLRKQRGWSQEELAMRLDVSRQSVSKWESNQSIPDMNKILAISTLFNVTTDYLLKEELTEEHANLDEEEMELIVPKTVSSYEAREYLGVVKKESRTIAFGVALCILGAISVVYLVGTAEYQTIFGTANYQMSVGLVGLFICVATAVALFIISSIKLGEYDHIVKSVVSVEKSSKEDIKTEFKEFIKSFRVKMTFSVVALILSVVPLIVVALNDASGEMLIYMTTLLLFIVMISVFVLVKESIRNDGYKNLLNKSDIPIRVTKHTQQLESIQRIYWTIVVAIYLGWSFISMDWHITWLVWPVAGVLSSVIPELFTLKSKN